MPGKLLIQARRDARSHITEGGFEETISLSTPSGDKVVSVTGFNTKHHLSFDTDGTVINAKNAHISMSEIELAELEYPVRNDKLEIDLRNHRVSVPDSSGVLKTFIIKENLPNETLGIIVCILGDWTE